MKWKKFALEYVFTCAMVAYHLNRGRFIWIVRTALKNWSDSDFKKLMKKLAQEGIII